MFLNPPPWPAVGWKIVEPTLVPVFGDPEGAEIAVTVVVDEQGTREILIECLCPACNHVSQIGLEESLGLPEGSLAPGVHYIRTWFEVHPGGPWGPTEYEGGLEINES